MKMTKKVSVIMSIYNEPIKYIEQSIGSMLKQTYENLEIILVLDNPENADAESFLNRVANKYKNIIFIKNASNCGLVRSLNKALDLCSGEYVARMDADDISYPQRIEEQVQYLNDNNLDLVGCNIENIDKNNSVTATTFYPETNKKIKKYLFYASAMAHPTWLTKKCVYDMLNGYREIDACEDYDFLIRAAQKNVKMGVCQKILFRYRINDSGISSTKKVIQKCNFRYLRKMYRMGNSFSVEEYNDYLLSETYLKTYKKLEKYYLNREEQRNIKDHKLLYYLKGVVILLGSTVALENIW